MKNNKTYEAFTALLASLTLILMPLWVRLYVVAAPRALQAVSFTPQTIGDYFASGKLRVLVFCAILSAIALVIAIITKKAKRPSRLILTAAAIYFAFVVLSAVFSKVPETAVFGIFGRSTGAVTAVCYIALFLFASCVLVTDFQKKIALQAFIYSGTAVATVAVLQRFNINIFSLKAFQLLIVPQQYQSGETLFNELLAYSTLANPNYTGIYCAACGCAAIAAVVSYNGKALKAIMLICSALCIFGVAAAGSLGAFLGAAAAIASTALLYLTLKQKIDKKLLKVLTAASAVFFAVIIAAAIAFKPIAVPSAIESPIATRLLGMETKGPTIWLKTDAGNFGFTKEKNGYSAMLADGTPLKPERVDKIYRVPERFANFAFVEQENGSIIAVMPEYQFTFNFVNGEYWLNLNNGFLTKAFSPTRLKALDSLDAHASGRIFLYSRSLPLIFKSPLLGYGPDSFACVFPQGDITGKLTAFNDPYIVADKPHSLYLQTALENGLIAVAALIVLCFTAVKSAIKRFLLSEKALLSVIAAVVVFLVCGLANDITIGIAPSLFIMLGLCTGRE